VPGCLRRRSGPARGPHSGDGTDDLTGHALRQLAERRGAWPGDDLTAITLTASLAGQAGRFLPEPVTSARLNGHTGHDTAQALATSPDQGRRRSGPDSPVTGGRWLGAARWRLQPPSWPKMIRLAVITGQPYLAAGDPLRAELAGLIGRVVVSRWRPDGVGPGVGVEEHRHLPVRA